MLTGQVALVTGASRGIGRAVAQKLSSMGATVIGTATSDEGATSISEYLDASACKGLGTVLDVCNQTQIDALITHIEKTFGMISILVNNAGITRDNLVMRMKDDEWDAVLDTNLKGVFRLSKSVMRGMVKLRQGRIINVTSVVGHAGNPGQANYCAAKAGVAGMTRSMARELGSRNITVNCVAPGSIDTDMTKALDEKQRAAYSSSIPLGRFGTPEEVAAAVGFLASPDAAYISGSTIHVNGGMHME
ncbi:MAG: 3-oxoacyl-ACP reductase FabG [Betaproteobacteria bacterium]